ncbi:MAG: hypothetical protein PHY31_05555 [Smithellaceae bacterium]|nr:hypothetical protein [Smithellaceae bacterium]
MTASAAQALTLLRDPSQFKWYVIPIMLLVLYIYAVEIGKKNWAVILAGLAYWGMDWFNEIWNALVFHFTQYAPVWGTPGNGSAYVILIGLNIEITLMFLIMGVAAVKSLPEDKNMKIAGIPNRWFYAVLLSIGCVIVECVLNAAGALTWEYSWWQTSFPYILFLIGYLPFFVVCFWVYDMETVKKQVTTVSVILGFDALCLIIFGVYLKWI